MDRRATAQSVSGLCASAGASPADTTCCHRLPRPICRALVTGTRPVTGNRSATLGATAAASTTKESPCAHRFATPAGSPPRLPPSRSGWAWWPCPGAEPVTREPRPTPPSVGARRRRRQPGEAGGRRRRRRCHHRPGRQARRRRGRRHGGDLRPQARPARGHLDHRRRRRRRGRQGARHRGIREGHGHGRGDLERARRHDGRWLQHDHDLGAHRRARRHPRPAGRDRQGALPQREHRRRHRAVRRHRVAGEDDAGQRRPGARPDEPGHQARRHRVARGRALPPPGRPRGHPEPARRPQGLGGPVAGRGAAEHRRAGARSRPRTTPASSPGSRPAGPPSPARSPCC